MKKVIFTMVVLCLTITAQSQKKTGSLESLKGEKSLLVDFDYSQTTYSKQTEAAFFEDKTKNLSVAEAKAWKEDWEVNAKGAFITAFVDEYNKDCDYVKFGSEAKYKVIVVFTEIYLGTFAGPFSTPAWLTGVFKFVEGTTAQDVATIPFKKVYGNPYAVVAQPTEQARVKDACSALGEEAADQFCKQLK